MFAIEAVRLDDADVQDEEDEEGMSLYISPSSSSCSLTVLSLSLKFEIAACKRASISSIDDCRFRCVCVEGEEEPDVFSDDDLDDCNDDDEADVDADVDASRGGEGDRMPSPCVVVEVYD